MRTTMENPTIEGLRAAIEQVDARLISLIAERVRLARALGEAKRSAQQPALDPAQEAAVIRRAARLARENGLPDDAIRDIFWQLIALCRMAQLDQP